MSPEGHGAQVLPDPDLGPKKVTHPYSIRGTLQLLFYKVFAKMHSWGSRDTLYPLYAPRTWGWGGTGLKPPKNLLTLKDHLLAKFHQYLSVVWISVENILKHCPPAPLGGSNQKTKNTRLLKFDFREILFYKYCTILKKKFTPLQVPPLTPATLDPGPKSKIFLHHFVCLVKCFPKWYDMIR